MFRHENPGDYAIEAVFYLRQLHEQALAIAEAMDDPLEREVMKIQINQVYHSGRRKALRILRRYMDREL